MKIEDRIDDSGRYRYWMRVEVERSLWDTPTNGKIRRYVLLNPSTASAAAGLDPTTQRLLAYSVRDGYHAYELGNAYALRATDPVELWKCEDPVGPDNLYALEMMVREALLDGEPIVCAWGVNVRRDRLLALREILTCDLGCFGTNGDGSPKHPLYLTKQTPIVPWRFL